MGNPGHGAMRQRYHMFLEFYNGALAMKAPKPPKSNLRKPFAPL